MNESEHVPLLEREPDSQYVKCDVVVIRVLRGRIGIVGGVEVEVEVEVRSHARAERDNEAS